MKLNSTTKLLLFSVAMLFSIGVMAQPANDNVCDAIDITGMNGFVESNAGATVQAGEEAITPPSSSQGCVSGFWCDFSGADGASGIDNSMWFRFDAPADGNIMISGCLSDFDTQIAVYEVGDCSDFSTFTYVWGDDDTTDSENCGFDASDQVGAPYSLSTTFTLECLNPGQTYYILIDGWQNADGDAEMLDGAIDMAATPVSASGDELLIIDPLSQAPVCMGGSDGAAGISITGPAPYTIEWSTGGTDLAVFDLLAGDYTVTVTNACGNTATQTITVPDGPEPTQVVATIADNAVVNPGDCGDGTIESNASGSDGQISIGVSSGTPPFTMVWNTGDTTAFLSGLAPGDYSVTIFDGCGNPPAVETFTLTAEAASGEPAGEDVNAVCGSTVEIGGGAGLGVLSQLNSDIGAGALTGNIACRQGGFFSENSYLRAFDLDADFGLSGEVKIEGLDFFIFAEAGPGFGGLQPVDFRLYTAASTDLAADFASFSEIASLNMMIPDLPEYEFVRIPIKATVDASEVLVVELFHSGGGAAVGHSFDAAAVDGVLPQPTYLLSNACNISTPTLMTDIGFSQQIIMNIIYRDASGNTYAWDDPNGDLSATDVANPSVTAVAPAAYTVTVTDLCGNSVIDDVLVDCGVGIIAPEDAVFTISPNPSNGIFQLQNTDIAKNMLLQVFDLQGKMMQTEQFNGTLHTLDLSAYPAGIYVLKLDNGVDIETHKLMVY